MANFNDWVQAELPKRPFAEVDGAEGQVLVRRGPGPRQVAFENVVLGSGGGFQYKYKSLMTDGVLSYDLPSIPSSQILVFINGVEVDYILSGVIVTITTYTAGEIESDDELTIYY